MPRKYTKKITKKITKTGGKKKKYSNDIPKYRINNDGGFGSVIMNLNSEETFVLESGALFFIKQKIGQKIKVKTKTGGILSGLSRIELGFIGSLFHKSMSVLSGILFQPLFRMSVLVRVFYSFNPHDSFIGSS